MDAILLTTAGIVFGGILNIVAAFLVERLRRPKLELSTDVWEGFINPGALDARTLRVQVRNCPLGGFVGFFVIRARRIARVQ